MASKEVGSPAIGIDLGMAYSRVAVWQHARVEIIPNEQGNRRTPSCVAFTDYQCLIGEGAEIQKARTPANTVFDAKRLIGRRFSDVVVQDAIKSWPFKVIKGPNDMPRIVVTYKGQEKQFSAEEISSMVLSKLKEVAEVYIGKPVTNAVVIMVPAYFSDCQRQATKDAAIIAGLKVIRMINEPTAAAIAYGVDNWSHLTRKRNVLVLDLGGGSFDVSLLTVDDSGNFDVKALSGDTHLGGKDFDHNLMNYCVKYVKKNWNKDITGNKRAMGRLKEACERAKGIISDSYQTLIELDALHNGQNFSMNITRARFEDLNLEVFSKYIKKLETCLADAKIHKRNLDVVILVGGWTRIPMIQNMLQEFFDGKQLYKSINPDEAVAHGAAVLAAKLSGQTTKKLGVMEATPLSLGNEVYGDLMSVFIPRNTPIPMRITRTFVTTKDNQIDMDTMVYQGERTKASENYLLGQLTVSGIPPAPKGEAAVEKCFEIDANGILMVTSKIISTGQTKTHIFKNYCGSLSEEEKEKMVKDAEKFKVEDQQYKKKVVALNDLEDFLYILKKKLKVKESDMAPKTLKNMKYVIDDTNKWLSSNKAATGDEIVAKKENLEFISKLAFSN